MNFLTTTAMCCVCLSFPENAQQSYFLFLGGDRGSSRVEKQIPKHWSSECVMNIMSVWSAATPQPVKALGVVMSGGVPGKGSQTLLPWSGSQNLQSLENH